MRIVLILLFLSLKSFGQWVLIPCPTTVNLNSVHFASQNIGYAVGDPIIIKTINQGTSWGIQSSSSNLNSVHCSHDDTVYTSRKAGPGGLMTFNGGNTPWINIPGLQQWNHTSVYSIFSKFIYFVGNDFGIIPNGGNNSKSFGIVAFSKNGGISWQYLHNNYMWPKFTSVQFIDTLVGYSCAHESSNSSAFVLKTTNGGLTWATLPQTAGVNWNSISFINANIGYASGNGGIIRKTTDGGVTWTQQYTYTGTNFKSIHFSTPDTGCVVGENGFIMGTIDGGTTWTQQYSGTTNNLNSVYFTDKNTGYIVGDNGTILKTAFGPVGLNENKFTIHSDINVYPNPAHDHFTIGNKNLKGTSELFDVSGRLLFTKDLEKNETTFSVEGMENGIYLLKIKTEEGVFTKKIVVE